MSIKQIIDMLVLIAGAHQTAPSKVHEQQFDLWLTRLEKATGLDRDGAIEYLFEDLEGTKEGAA